jgi:nucleoside-diphosphate-sugar epimerase
MIRWITSHLGTGAATEIVAQTDAATIDVRDLVDKEGNSSARIRHKLEQGAALILQGQRVVVLCDYGVSRSNAVAAGILALSRAIPLSEAVREVIRATGECEIKLEPLEAIRRALGEPRVVSSFTGSSRTLLLGGGGFIGQALASELEGASFVVTPTRSDLNLLTDSVKLDLLVKEHEISAIVHLANPRIYTSNLALGESLVMLRNVLDVCKANRTRLVFPSSWEVFSGYRSSGIRANEALPCLPKGPYGETKYLCEKLIENHAQRYGLACAVIRSGPVYGIGSARPKFIYTFLEKACANEPITTHRYLNGEPVLDLLHVRDYVRGLSAVITRGLTGVIHLGSGNGISTMRIAAAIVQALGAKSAVSALDIDDYCANVTMDTARAGRELDWQPAVALDLGLSEIIATMAGARPQHGEA